MSGCCVVRSNHGLKEERTTMRRIATIAAATTAALGASVAPAFAGEIDQGLEEVFVNTPEGQVISALVFMKDQGDIDLLAADHKARRTSFEVRNREVVRTLQDTAKLTQADLLAELAGRAELGEVESFQSFWIANIVRVDATEPVLRAIAQRDDVAVVYYNIEIEGIKPIAVEQKRGERPAENAQRDTRAVEPGVAAVRAPDVWAMGYTGEGILVATMDSGVAGNHPAIASRWRGLDPAYAGNPGWAWFDPITNTTVPTEFDWGVGHGTHTMGTVLGGAPGDQIGVAPGAQWISAGVIDRGGIDSTIANAILSFQWMASPTGNAGDSWAVPRVASNSWGTVASHGHPNCDQTFWQWIDNSEAAGTIQVFSAGNEGSGATTVRRPADRAQFNGQPSDYHSMAVGAIDPYSSSWPIAGFSSRGPTYCVPGGTAFIKPNISAPGVDTRSAHQNGGYAQLSGTSMASPHVNGVIALMLQACDTLTSDEVKQIIYETAFDLGAPGKDNVYGWGMIDAYEAVNRAIAECTIGIRLPDGAPSMFEPGVAASFLVEVVSGSELPVPGSEMLFYRFGGGAFSSSPLTPLGNGKYEATIPGPPCGEVVEFYVRVEGDNGSIRTFPSNAPQNTLSGLVGEFVTVETYYRDFASGLPQGWSASGLWHVTNSCSVSGPCKGPGSYAYYGRSSGSNSCTYNNGNQNSGNLNSAPITFPAVAPGEKITLKFCYNLETENNSGYDLAHFRVLNTSVEQRMAEASTWTEFSIDVTSLAGQSRTLQWRFDTVDSAYNNYRGWQVDRVRIEVTSLECEDPQICVGDLNNDGSVDVIDMLALMDNWGACGSCAADLNGDGVVDVMDLMELMNAWGACN